MEAAPYRLISDSTLTNIALSYNDIWHKWGRAWGVEFQPERALRAWETAMPSHPFWRCFTQDNAFFWLGWDADPVPHLQKKMFGPERDFGRQGSPAAKLAPALAERCWQALLDNLSRNWDEIPAKQSDLVENFFRPGSGVAIQQFHIGKLRLSCIFDAKCVEFFGGQKKKIALPILPQVHYKKILRPLPTSLPVEIGQADVGLLDLLSLHAGDVIMLNTTVDAPLAIRGQDGISLFHAYLGRQGKTVVLETVRQGK